MFEELHVENNKKLFRFEIALPSGEYAVLEYRWLKGAMVLMHTLVPKSQQGKGMGAWLVKNVLEYCSAHHLKIIVYCPFVQLYIHKHPEYNNLLPPTK